jgi:hypothetical protein
MKLTLGTVVITVWLNSRSSLSWMISMCSIPRKPQRKAKAKGLGGFQFIGQ